MGVETSQWDTLVAYWYEHETKKRTNQLMGARGAVMKVNKYGRGGKTMAEHKLVTHCLQPIMLWDVWCNGQFVLQLVVDLCLKFGVLQNWHPIEAHHCLRWQLQVFILLVTQI
jgi:hypothetical protein